MSESDDKLDLDAVPRAWREVGHELGPRAFGAGAGTSEREDAASIGKNSNKRNHPLYQAAESQYLRPLVVE
ncbi:hypothetical protein GCM10010187_57530 [Actinomadura coerulea]|nr:hypothetical protein GCM10010187_57530 [Actinomadura coerulea]